jgi:pimeloyl-ACP methyl ester carboxylesterase
MFGDCPTDAICLCSQGGSRMEVVSNGLDNEKLFKELDVKLVAIDRPGYASSTPHPDGNMLDFSKDILEVADKLNIATFSLVGISGGGIWALAAAHYIPKMESNRLANVGIISSDGQWAAPDFPLKAKSAMVMDYPSLVKAAFMVMRYAIFNYRKYGNIVYGALPKDAEVRRKKRFLKFVLSSSDAFLCRFKDTKYLRGLNIPLEQITLASKEGLRVGVDGLVRDLTWQTKKPWGFDLSEIKHPKMFLWHGELDNIVPVEVAQYACRKIPQMDCRIDKTMGHLLVVPKFREIATTIVQGK